MALYLVVIGPFNGVVEKLVDLAVLEKIILVSLCLVSFFSLSYFKYEGGKLDII